MQPASLLMLGVAFGFALVAIMTKRLTMTESTFSILFFMNLMQLPMNLAGVSGPSGSGSRPSHACALVGICLGGLLSHYCLTNAYRHGDATMVVPLDFLRIPLIAFVGWQLYGEPLDPFVLLGSACIIVGRPLLPAPRGDGPHELVAATGCRPEGRRRVAAPRRPSGLPPVRLCRHRQDDARPSTSPRASTARSPSAPIRARPRSCCARRAARTPPRSIR